MKRIIPGALGIMMSLIPSALLSQNLPPVAVDDTVYMCGSTVTIYVQNNDTNPDGDSLVLSIYSGAVNGSFSVNGNAIDYTPNVGYTGTDTLVYSLCDDGVPPLCDTATVIIHVGADYLMNESASICSGDSIFLAGAWQNSDGIYTDWYTTSYGCDSIVVTTLTVNPNPLASITASGPLNFCTGDSVILTANGGTSFSWSTGDTSQSITVYTPGTYSVVVSDSNGCSGNASANVNVVPPPNATISPAGPISMCSGDSATLTASAGTSWQWSTGETSQSIVVTDPGSYYVIVSNGSCEDTSASVVVNVNPLPVATISASGPTTFCAGGSVTLTASSGSTYLWSTGVTTQSINVVSSGNYWVIVSNGNGCTDTSATMAVMVNPLPVAFITPSGSTTFCEGGSVTLTSSAGSSWVWSTGATSPSILVTDGGTYYCTVTDANGCSATSASTIVTVNQPPVAGITADGPLALCQGEDVILTAVNGTSWLWSNGATSQSIVVSNAGTYYVIVSDQCGSDTATAVTVTITNGAPIAGITAAQFGYTYTFSDNSTGATSWNWNFGDNQSSSEQNPVHEYEFPGSYLVILVVTNACGSDTTSMVIQLEDGEKLGLFNAFSPNGDGYNDTWTIPMAEFYADNTVTIVNRWGNEVWKASAYDNDKVVWNGQNLSGENLPDGTYYYIITYDGKDSRGWVFIKR
jgi:gliding motility-associated-like protein